MSMNVRRRQWLLAAGTLPFLPRFGMAATPAAPIPFPIEAFETELASGRPVALVFHAGWCATCILQLPSLRTLLAQPRFQSIRLFVADYDQAKSLKRRYQVIMQSTLLVFSRGRMVSRSHGEWEPAELAARLASAL